MQAYLVIEENNAQCPLRSGTEDGSGHVVSLNGVAMVSTSYAAPYNSFTALVTAVPLLVSWVFDMDTGEGRFYNNPAGDVSVYWTPMQRAVGKVLNCQPTLKRTLENQPSVGEMYSIVKDGLFETDFSMSKVFIDKRKITPSKDSSVYNQYGFMGNGLTELFEYVDTEYANYFMVIMYMLDLSEDTANVARAVIMPCAVFESIAPSADKDRTIQCSISGRATYIRTVPWDGPEDTHPGHIPSYVQSAGCELYLTITTILQGPPPSLFCGDVGGLEYWSGQTFTTTSEKQLCSADFYVTSKVGTAPDIVCRLYTSAGGVATGFPIATSDTIIDANLVVGWNNWEFPTQPLMAAGTEYALVLESLAAGAFDQHAVIGLNDLNPYAGGNAFYDDQAVWANLGSSWTALSTYDLLCRIYSVIPL